MNVLVVEDDAAVWRGMNTFLLGEGHEPYWASRAAQAFEWLSSEPIELVLLDVDLGPGQLSGIDVLRAMVEHEAWSQIPVFIISGLPDDEIRDKARKPVVDLLRHVKTSFEKPINFQKLKTAMARVVTGRR